MTSLLRLTSIRTSRVCVVLALLVAPILASCDSGGSSPGSEVTVIVSGEVTTTSGESIKGADVIVRPISGSEETLGSGTTGSDGAYEITFSVFESDAPDTMRVQAKSENFTTTQKSVAFDESVMVGITMSIEFAGGNGTADNPYQVTTAQQLQGVDEFPDSHYVQTEDVNASETSAWNGGRGFLPIGNEDEPFTGSFDGSEHEIIGLTVTQDSADLGLFEIVKNGAIENVRLKEVKVEGVNGGTLVGVNQGEVINCHAKGMMSKYNSAGGLVGDNSGEIRSSTSAVVVSDGKGIVGGLVSENMADGVIVSSEASGEVASTASDSRFVTNAGGLVGKNVGRIQASQATGSVFGTTAGGLVAGNFGIIEDSFASGKVKTDGSRAGGLVGSNGTDGVILRSRAVGNVVSTAQEGTARIGGLVGSQAGGEIRRSKASGSVEASGPARAGGLVGEGAEIFKSYATGSVEAVTSNSNPNFAVGGLTGTTFSDETRESYATGSVSVEHNADEESVGGLAGNGSNLSSTFWDTKATGQSDGIGNGDPEGATGLTTSEMQGESAEENMEGFDFQDTWQTVMDDYPALQWEE